MFVTTSRFTKTSGPCGRQVYVIIWDAKTHLYVCYVYLFTTVVVLKIIIGVVSVMLKTNIDVFSTNNCTQKYVAI